jgi:ketosteroid isomerase-like protein
MTVKLVPPSTDFPRTDPDRGVFFDAARAAGMREAARRVDDRAHAVSMRLSGGDQVAVEQLRAMAVELELLAGKIERGGQ